MDLTPFGHVRQIPIANLASLVLVVLRPAQEWGIIIIIINKTNKLFVIF